MTMDHDPEETSTWYFWHTNPGLPRPERFTYRSRVGRRALDHCTFIRYPITSEMDEGVVTPE